MGLVHSNLTGVHMVHLTDDEIHLLAKANTSVVHCPTANLKLASGFAPISKLLDAGINVASKFSPLVSIIIYA